MINPLEEHTVQDRVIGSVIVRLAASESTLPWAPGPLPLQWGMQRTDAALRSTYLAFRAGQDLYSPSGRRHRLYASTISDDHQGAVVVTAVERLDVELTPGDRFSLGVAHIDASGPDPVGALTDALRPPGTGTSTSPLGQRSLELWGSPAEGQGRRVGSCLLLIPATPPVTRYEEARRLWAVGALSPIEPDPDDPAIPPTIGLSASWRAQPLRDGIGILWRSSVSDEFLPRAETLVRTVYTDVVLLARLQRLELEALADDLARIEHRAESSAELDAFTARATRFRNRLWWDDVGNHGHGNVLLRATQSQLRTPELFDRVTSDLAAFREAVEIEVMREAQRARARTEAQRAAGEHRRRRLQRLIEVVAGGYAGATLALSFFGATNGATVGAATSWTIVSALVGAVTVSSGGYLVERVSGPLSRPASIRPHDISTKEAADHDRRQP